MAIAIMGLTGCSMDDKNALTNSKDVVAKETEESSEVKDETSESTEQRAENVKEDRNDSYKKNEIKKKAESTTQATTEATAEVKDTKTVKAAKTGDNALVAFMFMTMIVSGLGIFLIIRKVRVLKKLKSR